MSAPTYAGKNITVQTLPTWQKINNKTKGVGMETEGDLVSKGK